MRLTLENVMKVNLRGLKKSSNLNPGPSGAPYHRTIEIVFTTGEILHLRMASSDDRNLIVKDVP